MPSLTPRSPEFSCFAFLVMAADITLPEGWARSARPPLLDSILEHDEMYGVMCGAICPAINCTMALAKTETTTYKTIHTFYTTLK